MVEVRQNLLVFVPQGPAQPVALTVGEKTSTCERGAPAAVQRVISAATMAMDLLLQTLATKGESLPSQLDHTKVPAYTLMLGVGEEEAAND